MRDDIYLRGIKKLALKYKKWILIGSIAIKIKRNKLVNRSILIDKKGKIKIFYDKIHMYNATLTKEKSILSQKHLQQEKN